MPALKDTSLREGTVELRLFFKRDDHEMLVERIYVPEDAPQSRLFEHILYVWGLSPDTYEINFFMAQDSQGAVIVTLSSLLMYVEKYRDMYGN